MLSPSFVISSLLQTPPDPMPPDYLDFAARVRTTASQLVDSLPEPVDRAVETHFDIIVGSLINSAEVKREGNYFGERLLVDNTTKSLRYIRHLLEDRQLSLPPVLEEIARALDDQQARLEAEKDRHPVYKTRLDYAQMEKTISQLAFEYVIDITNDEFPEDIDLERVLDEEDDGHEPLEVDYILGEVEATLSAARVNIYDRRTEHNAVTSIEQALTAVIDRLKAVPYPTALLEQMARDITRVKHDFEREGAHGRRGHS